MGEGVLVLGWYSSDRASRLPRDWKQRRELVAVRAGYQCEARLVDGSRCPAVGTDCDHIVSGDNHDLGNLQWLCSWHHKRKTSLEASVARKERAKNSFTRLHPGLISE